MNQVKAFGTLAVAVALQHHHYTLPVALDKEHYRRHRQVLVHAHRLLDAHLLDRQRARSPQSPLANQ